MTLLLRSLVACVACVAVYDIFCTVRQADTIIEDELNPIAAMLISDVTQTVVYHTGPTHLKNEVVYKTGDVSALVAAKVVGLLIAVHLMNILIDTQLRHRAAIIGTIAFFQLCLLLTLLS